MTDPYNITETGIQGFLKWLQVDNPGLYQKAAPEIAKYVPAAFSTHEQSRAFALTAPQLGFLGTDITQSSPGLVDISFDPSQVAPSADIADVANQGSATPSISDTITNIVGGIASVYMAKNQADIQKQYTQIQLQRAQAGLPPLPINSSQLGVPQMPVGMNMETQSLVKLGGLAILAVITLSMMRGRN